MKAQTIRITTQSLHSWDERMESDEIDEIDEIIDDILNDHNDIQSIDVINNNGLINRRLYHL